MTSSNAQAEPLQGKRGRKLQQKVAEGWTWTKALAVLRNQSAGNPAQKGGGRKKKNLLAKERWETFKRRRNKTLKEGFH